MTQNEPPADWGSLLAAFVNCKINTAVALAVVLLFAASTAATTLVVRSEFQAADYQPLLGKAQVGKQKVLGLAAYGYNQPVCNRGNCLNHMLVGFNDGGWQVRIDYQLQPGIVGAIRVNGWRFMDNITDSGSGYTGYDLDPGETYNFVLYKKLGRRLIKLTTLTLTGPEAPQPEPVYCSQDTYQCPGGNWVSRTGPYCQFICPPVPSPTPVPAYGYLQPTGGVLGIYRNDNVPYPASVKPGSFGNVLFSLIFTNSGDGTLGVSDFSFNASSGEAFRSASNLSAVDAKGTNVGNEWQRYPDNNQISIKFSPTLGISGHSSRYLTVKADIAPQASGSLSFRVGSIGHANGYISPSNVDFGGNWWSNPVQVDSANARVGKIIILNSTIYLVGDNGLYGFPDLTTFYAWNYTFSEVLEPNSAERQLTIAGVVPSRSPYCNSPLDQIKGACPEPVPNISISSPTAGDQWQIGSTHIIKWDILTTGAGYVNIDLISGAACKETMMGGACTAVQNIASNISNNGVYSWTIATPDFKDTYGYKIRITGAGKSSAMGTSGTFGILSLPRAPYLKVISPNGGEQLFKGQSYKVTWQAPDVSSVVIGLFRGSSCIANVEGTYSLCGTPVSMFGGDSGPYLRVDNTGSFDFKISPSLADGQDYYLAVGTMVTGDPAGSGPSRYIAVDSSDRPFSILSPPQAPYIKVTSPNGGESIVMGNQYAIRWESNIDSREPVNIMINKQSLGSGGSAYIAKAVPNTGYYVWYTGNGILPLPNSITQLSAGSDYTITVSLTAGGLGDSSDGAFSLLVSQQLSSLGNVRLSDSSLTKGQTYRIKWDSSGVDKVYLKLRKNSVGDTVRAVTDGAIINNGYFDWIVPVDLPDGNDYAVRVVSAGSSLYADSVVFSLQSINLQPVLYMTLDPASRAATNIVAGMQDIDVVTFRFLASGENITVASMGVSTDGLGCPFNNLRLVDASTGVQLGSVVSSFNSGCGATFDNLNFTIPQNSSRSAALRVSVLPSANNLTVRFSMLATFVPVTASGKYVSVPTGSLIYGNPMTIVPTPTSVGGSGGTSLAGSTGSGAALPTYRYIKVETPQGNSWIAWREIEVYDANGQKITPVSASASSEYKNSTAPRVFDGDVNTVWNSGSYSNGVIILDLGADKLVSAIRLLPANFPNPAATSHYVSGKTSYDANFKAITNFSGLIYDNQWLSYKFSP